RPSLQITVAGVEGDHNYYRARKLNHTPDQAVLIVTEAVLLDLNAEGWPVSPGDLGENLTLRVTESSLVPGSRVEVGQVVMEISLACDPCRELYTLPFVGPEKGPAFLKTMVGRRGWYARVLTEGGVVSGMPVRVSTPVSTAASGT
ncbi:MAG: MOSC domain-containing protein, partial [Gemmatimonadota bacterium]